MKRKTLYIRHHNFKVLKSNYLKAERSHSSIHSIVIIFSKVYTIQPNNLIIIYAIYREEVNYLLTHFGTYSM